MSTNENAPEHTAENASGAATEADTPTEAPLLAEGPQGIVLPGAEAATDLPTEDLVPPTGSTEDLIPPAGAPWTSDDSAIPEPTLDVDAPLDEEPAPSLKTGHAANTAPPAESRVDASPEEESVPPTGASEDLVSSTGAPRIGADSEIPGQPLGSEAPLDEKPVSLEDAPPMVAPDVAPVDVTPPAGKRKGTDLLTGQPVEDDRPTGGAP